MFDDFFLISFVPLMTGIFSALSCTLVGNFLILRKQAMLSDTISHVVLPGIVISYYFFGSLGSNVMLFGALGAGLVAAFTISFLQSQTKMDSSAAMAITLSVFFAAGVLMIEFSAGGNVHLDVEHALYGNLESLIWIDGNDFASIFDPIARQSIPIELFRSLAGFLVILLLIIIFWRPLFVTTFDETFAQVSGVFISLVSGGIAVAATIAAIVSFDAVGSIIVVAMFICPPAAARVLTNKIFPQMVLSLIFAALAATLGYSIAGYLPIALGFDTSISAAGTISTLSGLILAIAMISSKR